ncbi:MAG: C4-dicarboxylate TRAP transporter large permease protein DctM [Firmicutes bacterium]|nr:C4-dicarboxylate TRAP transporter large permease protein DctM [Bacillota bacterium]
MSVEFIALGMFGSLFALLLAGIPLAFVGGGVATIFILLLWGTGGFMLVIAHVFDTMGSYTMVCIPMFIFMATMLERSGVGEGLFKAIHLWTGQIKGSLCVATIITCAVIAAMVGIVGAGVVMMGLIALPAMLKLNYDKNIALGSILAGGTLGQLIPPSVIFVVYAMVAGVSIGKLFLGGLCAGLILVSLYLAYILIRCRLQPHLAPSLPREERELPISQKLAGLKGLIIPMMLMSAVLGTIFLGIATPTEAAGIGALGATLSAAIHRQLTWENLKTALFQTTQITCMIAWIFFTVAAFSSVFTLAGAGKWVEEVILGLPFGPMGIIISMQVVYLLLGVPMDWLGCLMITGPIFIPIVRDLGFDPIWFGVLFNMNMQIAFLSPPVGSAMYYLKGVAPPEITIGDIFRSTVPFVGLQFIGLILVIAFPQLVTWLPHALL